MKLRKISLTLLIVLLSVSCCDVRAADEKPPQTTTPPTHASPKPAPIMTPQTPVSPIPGAPSQVFMAAGGRASSDLSTVSRREGEGGGSEGDDKEIENQRASLAVVALLERQTETLAALPAQNQQIIALLERQARAAELQAQAAQASEQTQKQLGHTLDRANAIAMNRALALVPPNNKLPQFGTNFYEAMQDPQYLHTLIHGDEERKIDHDCIKSHADAATNDGSRDAEGQGQRPEGQGADEMNISQPKLTRKKAFAYNLFYWRYSPLTWLIATAVVGRLSNRAPARTQRALKISAIGGGFLTFMATIKTVWDTALPKRSFLAAHLAKQQKQSSSMLRSPRSTPTTETT